MAVIVPLQVLIMEIAIKLCIVGCILIGSDPSFTAVVLQFRAASSTLPKYHLQNSHCLGLDVGVSTFYSFIHGWPPKIERSQLPLGQGASLRPSGQEAAPVAVMRRRCAV